MGTLWAYTGAISFELSVFMESASFGRFLMGCKELIGVNYILAFACGIEPQHLSMQTLWPQRELDWGLDVVKTHKPHSYFETSY